MSKDPKTSVGQIIYRWTIIGRHEDYITPSTGRRSRRWLCKCSCGTERVVHQVSLRSGASKSCGCFRQEKAYADNLTHGHSNTATYRSWRDMQSRCCNEANKSYKNYGARGIKVCDRWAVYENFLEDMGEKPVNLTLDRSDNSGNYTPENCKWATKMEQQANTRANRLLTYGGETKHLAEWARSLGITHSSLQGRLKAGWSMERALTEAGRVNNG